MFKRNTLIFIIILVVMYVIYRSLLPVMIVDLHHSKISTGYSYILVKNFPITKAGKIAWWKKNQATIKEKYGIPRPDSDGDFNISIWDFGDGYQIEKPKNSFLDFPSHSTDHLICFEDMKTEENCIEKNRIFEISKTPNSGLQYRFPK